MTRINQLVVSTESLKGIFYSLQAASPSLRVSSLELQLLPSTLFTSPFLIYLFIYDSVLPFVGVLDPVNCK